MATEVGHAQNRMDMYKKKGGGKIDQVARRKQMLEEQKQRRYDYLNHVRMIAATVDPDPDPDAPKPMEQSAPPKNMDPKERKKWYRKKALLDNQLMFSEWMTVVPEDLEVEWMLVPCPKGKRALIIASGGITTAYSKGGYVMNKFSSHLPGGNKRWCERERDFTILDCVFNDEQKTYYILDMMCWKDHPIYDSETEFRFYWLHTKLQELPQLFHKSKANPFKFIPLPNYSCNRNNITAVMATPMNFEVDGLLFYHKRAHYTFGQCPLVVWLKAYMLPDLLGIPVPDLYMQQMPSGYCGFHHFMDEMERNKQMNAALKEKGLCGVSIKKMKKKEGDAAAEGATGSGDAQPMEAQQTRGKQSIAEAAKAKPLSAQFVSGGVLGNVVPDTGVVTRYTDQQKAPEMGVVPQYTSQQGTGVSETAHHTESQQQQSMEMGDATQYAHQAYQYGGQQDASAIPSYTTQQSTGAIPQYTTQQSTGAIPQYTTQQGTGLAPYVPPAQQQQGQVVIPQFTSQQQGVPQFTAQQHSAGVVHTGQQGQGQHVQGQHVQSQHGQQQMETNPNPFSWTQQNWHQLS